MITFHEGDLLKSDCHIICHQVNELRIVFRSITKTHNMNHYARVLIKSVIMLGSYGKRQAIAYE